MVYHKNMRWIFFTPVIFLFYAGICFYIGVRILGFTRFLYADIKPLIFWIIWVFFCLAPLLINFISFNINFLRNLTSLWMAFFLYMLMFLVISEALKLIIFLTGKKTETFNIYATGAALCLCVLLLIFGIINARSIKTINYNITLHGSGNSIRAVLLSDLHIGSLVNKAWIERITEKVNKAQPDIVLIAGDIFDGNINVINDLPGVIKSLGSINAPLGTYACLGNHDVDRQAIRGGTTQRIEGILKESGVTLLQDEVIIIRDNLHLGGRRDARPIGLKSERKSADELVKDITGTIIMMDHQPVQFPHLEKAGVDFVVSGHTHRGQIFPASIFTYFIFKAAGASHYGHWKGETMQGIVTSGAGLWGPPVRIGTNSEIAVINIEFMP